MAFAPDALTSAGGYPGDDYKGGQAFNKIDKAKLMKDWEAAARWLKARPDCTGKVCATGFCYGGGVSKHPGRGDGPGPGGRRALLRDPDHAGRRPQDQGGDPDQPRGAG